MIKVQLKGLPALMRNVGRTPGLALDHAKATVTSTVRAVETRARSLVKVDTGALRNAIQGRVDGLRGGVGIAEGGSGGRRPSDYWRHVEYGTRHMAASPFLRPAAEAEAPALDQRVREIGRLLEREWGKWGSF